jgi:hypothetical protein
MRRRNLRKGGMGDEKRYGCGNPNERAGQKRGEACKQADKRILHFRAS